jgi:hypothetical protein
MRDLMAGGDALTLAPLLSTIQELYPDGIVRVSRRGGDPGPGRHFCVLFSARRPRLLVPIEPRAAAVASRRETAADGAAKAFGRAMIAAVVGSPVRQLFFGDMVSVEPLGDDTVEDHLGNALGFKPGRLRFALAPGAPRANSKPVLDLLTEDGSRLGFAKVSTSELSARLVQEEARTLHALSNMTLRHLDVPSVLHSGVWRNREIMVQAALPNGRFRGGQWFPVDAMREVATVAGHAVAKAGSSSWLTGLGLRAEQMMAPNRQVLLPIVAMFAARHGAVTLSFGSWHGDWGPWNMSWAAGRPQVWDWERFATDVPIGLDAVHFTAHRALRHVGRRDIADRALAKRAVRALTRLGVAKPAVDATIDAYLLEMAFRFAGDAAETQATSIRTHAEWHLAVAERRLGIFSETKANEP